MKTRSPLTLLVIFGIAAILLMPGNFSQSAHTGPATTGDDFLQGHDGGETISGLGGNDQIFGLSGSDILNGDAGDDLIHGGESSDVMDGGPDDDLMFGGQGGDKISGGTGNDEIYGGSQGDNIHGDEDDDEIYGGFQSDTIFGGPGDDQLFGGPGSDNIFADDGTDTIFGGVKNDNLFAGNDLGSVDMLHGGIGNDHLIGSLVGQATLDGGEDDDDGDGFYNEDPVDFDQFGQELNNDGDIESLFGSPTFIQEDGPGNDNDVCFWDGGPTQLVSHGDDGIPNTIDDVYGDDVLVLDDFGDPTCETVHVLGKDPITLSGKKGGGGGKSNPPGILTAAFVETDNGDPETPAGTLTLGFNTDVSQSSFTEAQVLERISIGNLGVPLLELTGSTFDEPHNQPSVTFTLLEAHALLILGLFDNPGTILTVTVDKDLFVNKFGNPNEDTLLGLSVDPIDISGPLVIGSAYVTGSGVLTVAFDEPVDELTVDQGGFHVRETGTSSGGETIGGASVVSVGDTLEITLLEAQRLAINALASHELDVDAVAVADLDGNDNPGTNNIPITVQTDTFIPVAISATYDATFDILTITFNENIDASATDLTKIFVNADGNFVDNPLSAGATVTPIDGNPISITITDGPTITAIEALATPMLGVADDAFSDLSGLKSIDKVIPITLTPTDLTGPVIELVPLPQLDSTFETLSITFDEAIDTTPDSQVDLTKVFVRETGTSTGGVVLTGATLVTTSDDSTVEIQLTGTQFGDINALSSPELDVDAGAFQDTKGNPILATTDIAIETTVVDVSKPLIIGATYDPTTDLLIITFDDTMNAGATALDKVYVSNPNKRNQFNLVGASVLSVGLTLEIDLTGIANLAAIEGIGSPQLDVGKNAFTDDAGNRSDRDNNVLVTVLP